MFTSTASGFSGVVGARASAPPAMCWADRCTHAQGCGGSALGELTWMPRALATQASAAGPLHVPRERRIGARGHGREVDLRFQGSAAGCGPANPTHPDKHPSTPRVVRCCRAQRWAANRQRTLAHNCPLARRRQPRVIIAAADCTEVRRSGAPMGARLGRFPPVSLSPSRACGHAMGRRNPECRKLIVGGDGPAVAGCRTRASPP